MSKELKKRKTATSEAAALLAKLNKRYYQTHRRYERLFWQSYMGDHSIDDQFSQAQLAREAFRTSSTHLAAVTKAKETATKTELAALAQWEHFFTKFQTPPEAADIFAEVVELEKQIQKKQTSRTEGYIDPKTKQFVTASRAQMSEIMSTHPDERIRKACFKAQEELALTAVPEYIKLVKLRNDYAQALGYEDFYAYKVFTEEGMTKQELFKIFDEIYDKTKYAFAEYKKLEQDMPGLRKPWNRNYLMAGDFTKEEDQYFPFTEALERWGRSFAAMGISYQDGTLQLDLLDRKGKYENGFCHWPDPVRYVDGKRQPGSANFTCNVVYGQPGSAAQGYNTLFHEGGHAAHLLNSTQKQICVNTEYPPASTAWDETQSMFLDTMFSSIEWKTRYAKNAAGEVYPVELFERKLKKLHRFAPLGLMGISSVMAFEKAVYETKDLTEAKLKTIAKQTWRKYTDYSVDSYRLLSIPHIYSWESACSYHGYGLAVLALSQWREYFYDKYGAIVDTKQVGKEMTHMWQYASSETFSHCVQLATGKKLSPKAFLKNATASERTVLKRAKERVAALAKVKPHRGAIKLHATIKMVDGKKTIATNRSSFEAMAKKYATWLETKRVNTPSE